MAVFGAILAVVLLNVRINGEITPESIGQFNIGQLFAFYEAEKLCTNEGQFAVAKKIGSNDCQWEIGKDLQPATITSEGLPITDINGNCYFSCVFDRKEPASHTEMVINRKLKGEHVKRKDFDLYTYLEPCKTCIGGVGGGGETAELVEFKAVYYTLESKGEKSKGMQVKNDALLKTEIQQGLAAIKETTKVTLRNIKNAIQNGKDANKSEGEIIGGIKDNEYEKNAVESYFKQHPLN